jgi:hypothetical protein
VGSINTSNSCWVFHRATSNRHNQTLLSEHDGVCCGNRCDELEAEQLERGEAPIARGGGRPDIPMTDKSMDALRAFQ